MIKKYVKKPIEIEAVRFTSENGDYIRLWANGNVYPGSSGECLKITTLEGEMTANVGDYIIKGIKGEYYPCKSDIFTSTYTEI